MKFSTEFNDIEYIFETTDGAQTKEQYHLFFNSKKRSKYDRGEMKFFTLKINAICDGIELNFEVQGVPLSTVEQEQVEELEDFFEANELFEKIENMYESNFSEDRTPRWGLKEY